MALKLEYEEFSFVIHPSPLWPHMNNLSFISHNPLHLGILSYQPSAYYTLPSAYNYLSDKNLHCLRKKTTNRNKNLEHLQVLLVLPTKRLTDSVSQLASTAFGDIIHIP